MRIGRLLLVIFGSLLALIAIALLAAGAVLLWVDQTGRDDDGFVTSSTERLQSTGYAITSERIDLGAQPGEADWLFDEGDLGEVRLRVATEHESPVFIGVGPAADVTRYLDGVPHDELASADFSGPDLGVSDIEYRRIEGDAQPPGPPGQQPFWAATAEGPGEQTLTWDVTGGAWTAVVMNADASVGVEVRASVGAEADWLLPLAIGLLVGGGVLLAIAIVLIVVGAVGLGRKAAAPEPAPAGPAAVTAAPATVVAAPAEPAAAKPAYPARLDGELQPDLSRWLWLVKWLLVIPHAIVLFFLWIAFVVLSVVAFFAILFTGRYPRGIFDFNLGVLRWSWRVGFYSYSALGTDRYPPFTLDEVPDYPARFDVDYPEQLSRGLVLVKWWLLAIPHYLIIALFGSGWWWGRDWNDDVDFSLGGGLIGILVFIAAVWLLFSGRYPRDLFNVVMGFNRWVFRVVAYASLMRDEYPPFRLDQGPRDPGTPESMEVETPSEGQGT